MPYMQYDNVNIAAMACAVPSFMQGIDTDPGRGDAAYTKNYIRNVGVKSRHISLIRQTGTDLCFAAAQNALRMAGWDAQSVDAVIFFTQSSDYRCPGNAMLLHYLLDMKKTAAAFDVNLGCSAFVYGLQVGSQQLQSPAVNRILLAFSDTIWPKYYVNTERGLDFCADKLKEDNSFLFGEGGSVMLLEKKSCSPDICLGLWTDGSGYKYLHGLTGMRHPEIYGNLSDNFTVPNGETVQLRESVYMDGPAVMMFTTSIVVDSIKEFMGHYKTDVQCYDGLVLHQANLQIIKTMAKRLKIDMEKVPLSIDRYANTNAASVPLTINAAYAARGEGINNSGGLRLLASSFGVGLSWGVADFYVSPSVISPIFMYDGLFEEGLIRYAANPLS
jgi:3-oxoacyl-[acyl-carrier-protein] synthase-3